MALAMLAAGPDLDQGDLACPNGSAMPGRQPPPAGARQAQANQAAERPNHVWAIDFQFDEIACSAA